VSAGAHHKGMDANCYEPRCNAAPAVNNFAPPVLLLAEPNHSSRPHPHPLLPTPGAASQVAGHIQQSHRRQASFSTSWKNTAPPLDHSPCRNGYGGGPSSPPRQSAARTAPSPEGVAEDPIERLGYPKTAAPKRQAVYWQCVRSPSSSSMSLNSIDALNILTIFL
jgi:hypothetical protein